MRNLSATLLATMFGVSLASAAGDGLLSQPTNSLTLFLRLDHPLPSITLTTMQNEVTSAFSTAYVELHFELPNQALGVYGRSAVVRFRGECNSAAPVRRSSTGGARQELAVTHVADGNILPFSDIDCDAVRQTLGRVAFTTSMPPDSMLGRALGRVVAHELYHILLRDGHHGKTGLASASFSRSDLLAVRRSFDKSDLNRIVESLRTKVALNHSSSPPTPCTSRPPRIALSFSSSSANLCSE